MDGGGQAVRQDPAVGEVLGALGQRAVDGVVPAEDEGRQGGETGRGEGAVSVTMPVGGWSPAATAAQPAIAVVATEPRAPMSQTPKRGRGRWWGGTVRRTWAASLSYANLVRVPVGDERVPGAGPAGRRAEVRRPPPAAVQVAPGSGGAMP
ncbi:hypothetical protein SHKM778_35120 [Streptomyces sp. KM77-8]|uniref:Uncharacterized protein n=1 Tax=Streptomyces haneummycinicus TaxID=3074435 RepID=A0AAT9HI78_9ACTN